MSNEKKKVSRFEYAFFESTAQLKKLLRAANQ
jgi:hypothetical protein